MTRKNDNPNTSSRLWMAAQTSEQLLDAASAARAEGRPPLEDIFVRQAWARLVEDSHGLRPARGRRP